MSDRINTKCRCGGTYKETDIHDDWHGVLHCDKCGEEIKRHSEDEWCIDENGNEQPGEMFCIAAREEDEG